MGVQVCRRVVPTRTRCVPLVSWCLGCVLVVASAGVAAAAPVGDAAGGTWAPPVEGPVVRRFEAPSGPYGPGHRGIDFSVAPGTEVRAAGPGVVAFAGSVGGARHVVVAHPGDLRTSYSYLDAMSVRGGAAVETGDVLGRTGGRGEHHDGVLHFGLRVGERYVDPLLLFGRPDPADVVHLAPVTGVVVGTRGEERLGLARGLDGEDGGGGPGVLDRVRGLGGRALGGVAGGVRAGLGLVGAGSRSLLGTAARLVEPAVRLLAAGAARFPGVLRWLASLSPVAIGGGMLLDVGRGFAAWTRTLGDCDRDAPGADGTGGSGHRVMVVAGINSSRSVDGSSVPRLPIHGLGYGDAEVEHFSYDGFGAYGRADTYVAIEVAARRLGEQLRAMQRESPGREVDLVAHSQGGVVVLAFLALVYDPADPSYPPLGTTVTLASPLEGAPVATASRLVAQTESGARVLQAVSARSGGSLPPPDAPSVHDLAEGSQLMTRLDAARLPEQVEFTTIGAALDYVVPASQVSVDGATEVVVNPWSAGAHGAVVSDPEAMRAVRAALEGRAPPCQSFATALVGAVAPAVITRIEHGVGRLGAAAGAAADALG